MPDEKFPLDEYATDWPEPVAQKPPKSFLTRLKEFPGRTKDRITNHIFDIIAHPETSFIPFDLLAKFLVALVLFIIVAAVVGAGWYLFQHPEVASVLRDIAIILFGWVMFLIVILMTVLIAIVVYLALKMVDLMRLIRQEVEQLSHFMETDVRPVLKNLQETTADVHSTATFINDKAVQPVITTASAISATKTVFRTLFQKK